MKGVFIVLEGLDRSGKSTQAKALHKYLTESKTCEAIVMAFPDRTSVTGKVIDSFLQGKTSLDKHAVHLLFSANRWEASAVIEAHLLAGRTVICDRYSWSGMAYSVANGLDFDWCSAPEKGLPLPDITIFLDMDVSTAEKRHGFGKERFETTEFQTRVKDAYKKIRKASSEWTIINANKSIDDVEKDIREFVSELFVDKSE